MHFDRATKIIGRRFFEADERLEVATQQAQRRPARHDADRPILRVMDQGSQGRGRHGDVRGRAAIHRVDAKRSFIREQARRAWCESEFLSLLARHRRSLLDQQELQVVHVVPGLARVANEIAAGGRDTTDLDRAEPEQRDVDAQSAVAAVDHVHVDDLAHELLAKRGQAVARRQHLGREARGNSPGAMSASEGVADPGEHSAAAGTGQWRNPQSGLAPHAKTARASGAINIKLPFLIFSSVENVGNDWLNTRGVILGEKLRMTKDRPKIEKQKAPE